MRTLIYVHNPSTVTIQAKNPDDVDVVLCRFNRSSAAVQPGTHKLDRGIYLVVSRHELEVSGGDVTIQLLRGDKDTPPEPRIIALEPGATAAQIKQFMEVAKGITVGSPPAPPVSSGTSKIKDDPDGI
jgi:hypothetical protein